MAADPRSQFQHWHPQLRGYFSTLVASSGAPQYANYTSTSTEDACVRVISCILESTPEAVKINMASAGLLLGLLPALLGLLGSSTIETSCLAARRPVLSVLLSLGSPAVNPIRIYDYRDIVEKIINLNETVSLPIIPRGLLLHKATLILTYGLTFAVIANTTSVNLDLGQKTVWNNSCRYSVFPLLYGIIAVGVHVLGLMAFSQRLHILPAEGVKVSWGASALLRRLKHEFTREAEAGKIRHGASERESEVRTPVRIDYSHYLASYHVGRLCIFWTSFHRHYGRDKCHGSGYRQRHCLQRGFAA